MKNFTQSLIIDLLKEKILSQTEMKAIAGGGKGAGSIESIKGGNPAISNHGFIETRPAN